MWSVLVDILLEYHGLPLGCCQRIMQSISLSWFGCILDSFISIFYFFFFFLILILRKIVCFKSSHRTYFFLILSTLFLYLLYLISDFIFISIFPPLYSLLLYCFSGCGFQKFLPSSQQCESAGSSSLVSLLLLVTRHILRPLSPFQDTSCRV